MILEFTYTECTSPGAFKKETGFKIKSLAAYEQGEDGIFLRLDVEKSFAANRDYIKSILDSATSSLTGYAAVDVDPFATPAEFLALPRGFIYSPIELPDGSSAWLLARLSTSGPGNGRPRNPFHQGFLMLSRESGQQLVSDSRFEDNIFLRPVDFTRWRGWLNPRGDAQVDSSNLNESTFPQLEVSLEELSEQHSQKVSENLAYSSNVLTLVARNLKSSSSTPLPGANSTEFFNWTDIVSHLIPGSVIWELPFASTWTMPQERLSRLGFHHFYWSNEVPDGTIEIENWAFLATKVFELGLEVVVYDAINEIDLAFNWTNLDHISYAMIPLGLSLLCLPVDDFGPFSIEVSAACFNMLNEVIWPIYSSGGSALEDLKNRLTSQNTLMSTLAEKHILLRKIETLSVMPKVKL